MARSNDGHSSNDATARENSKFNLVDRLDQLQWQLDDIDMQAVDRFEIDHYMGTLMKDVVERCERKKRRRTIRLLKKVFSAKRSKKALQRLLQKKNKKNKGPILPMVVFVPSSDDEDANLTDPASVVTSLNQGDMIYYLQDDAYTPKKQSFFESIASKEKGMKERGLTRAPTEDTLRMDASFGADLFDKTNDDCFWGLSTGI